MTRTKRQGSYEVGYGRPPPEHRFEKGQPSRNPKGRPRKSSLGMTEIAQLLNEKVIIKIGGRRKRVPYSVAFLQMLKAKALQGDSKPTQLIFDLIREPGIGASEPDSELHTELRSMLYKPEHDPLRESIEAWKAAARGELPPKTGV